MAFKDHFSGVAAAYAASRPVYPEVLADRLAELPGSGRALAWDAGCGSGQLSTLLAERFERVVATDASPQQIERARPHPRVEYRVASAEASGLPAGSVDLSVAAQAAHWFDLDAYYAEVRRVSRPGAAIALVTYARPRVDDEVNPALDELIRAVGPYWPPERGPVDTLYEGLPFPFDEVAFPRTWMTLSWPLEHLLAYSATWSSTIEYVRRFGADAIEAVVRPLRAAWGDPERKRTVRWPLGVRAGRV